MSVTVLNEIDKAEVLVNGLRQHLSEVKQLGITAEAINNLEKAGKVLKQKDAEVDALRNQASTKGRENRELLLELKSQMLEMRQAIKGRYPQNEWINYGVQDKR